MFRIMIIAAISLMSVSIAQAKDWKHAWARVDTNMHGGPGRSFPIMERMIEGFDLALYKCRKGWCEVGYNGKRGYARQKDIRTEHDNSPIDCDDLVAVLMGLCD